MPRYKNPAPTVDLIIEIKGERARPGIVLINRKNPPYGWALPGGFVDYGESCEDAALREAREETALDVRLVGQLHTYSDPGRDPRKHTITTVFMAEAKGIPRAGDDAREAAVFARREIPRPLAFDHERILSDYFRVRDREKKRRTCRPATKGRTMDEKKREPEDPSPADLNLKEAARVWGLAEADVIRSFLESNGISCIYRGLVAPSVYSFTTDGMGEIRIMVKPEDYETAKELLEKSEIPPESPE